MYQGRSWQGDERVAPRAQNGTEVSRCAARWGRGAIGIAGHKVEGGQEELDHQGKEELGADSHRV